MYLWVTGVHLRGRWPYDTSVLLLDISSNGRTNPVNDYPLIPVYLGGCVFSPAAVLASRKTPEVKFPQRSDQDGMTFKSNLEIFLVL